MTKEDYLILLKSKIKELTKGYENAKTEKDDQVQIMISGIIKGLEDAHDCAQYL